MEEQPKASLTGDVQHSERTATPEEYKKLYPLQAALALIIHIETGGLAWDYRVALSRINKEDKEAKNLRDTAMSAWLRENTDLFRLYYMSSDERKREVLSTDPKDEQACKNLLGKFTQFKEDLKRPS